MYTGRRAHARIWFWTRITRPCYRAMMLRGSIVASIKVFPCWLVIRRLVSNPSLPHTSFLRLCLLNISSIIKCRLIERKHCQRYYSIQNLKSVNNCFWKKCVCINPLVGIAWPVPICALLQHCPGHILPVHKDCPCSLSKKSHYIL